MRLFKPGVVKYRNINGRVSIRGYKCANDSGRELCVSENNEANKTSVRAPGDAGVTQLLPARSRASVVPPADATQLTQYGTKHHNSIGFAQARALVEQSQAGRGMLLKKRFLLEDVLGHGGMGTVYRTKDLRKVEAEDPNPYIATKVLNQDFKDHPDAFVTLQQETAKSQTLAHPNIVTVHDFDRDGDTLFMTMELLTGTALDQLIKTARNKGLPKEQVWKITRDLCAALSYAHQRQLIHADFKPGNVFVNTDGSAKVLDFGIARAASKDAQRHQFDAGQLGALTPAYATIEMVNDKSLTFSDDVYALACVVYEMLAGRHPFNGYSALEALQRGLAPKRLDNLSSREWRALSRALALTKAERTATIAQFAEQLFPRRNPLVLSTAVLLALISLVGAGWFGFTQYQSKLTIQHTVVQKIKQAEQCFAQGDFDCAVEHGRVATSLEPGNSVALALLQAAEAASAERATQDKINDLVREAEACLAQQDINCALLFSTRARELDASHSQSIALEEKIHAQQRQMQMAVAAQQQLIARDLSAAQTCLQQRDYGCALAQAAKVLQRDAANTQAIEVRQSATLAQQQQQALTVRIAKLMDEAEQCMTRKNYACAIAKAESALDLDAGSEQAAALKQRAQDTQRKLKETGFTIK